MGKLYANPLYIGALRNQPCICGSGKKIKQCHGQARTLQAEEAKALSEMITNYDNQKQILQDLINQNREGSHV